METPSQFGPYRLLERIALGGMAEVFKAVEYGAEGFERIVAVKKILPHVAEDDEFITMFKDEAKIAVQLTHPNIAQIYRLDNEADSFYIALEYIAGRDLKTLFERARKANALLPLDMVCFTIMKVCEGLDYAHAKKDKYGRSLGIIHRDVSPPNILVAYEGQVKLIDFGVAKAAGRVSKTQAGILKGKFGYMSPEQVRGMPLDRRSDVFSLGVVFWELLTTQRLFQGDTDFATLERVRDVIVPRPTEHNPAIPPELERIVFKALAANPDDRYQTAMELRDELQAFLFAQGLFYGEKDLSGWMHSQFAKEIELDKDKANERNPAPGEGSKRPTMAGGPPAPPVRKPPVPPGRSGGPPTAVHRAVSPSTLEPSSPAGRNRAKTMLMTNQKAEIPTRGTLPPTGRAPARTAPPVRSAAPAAPQTPAAAKGSDFEWDDEELETRLFDNPSGDEAAAPMSPSASGGGMAAPIVTPPVPSAARAPAMTPPAMAPAGRTGPQTTTPAMPVAPAAAPAYAAPAAAPMQAAPMHAAPMPAAPPAAQTYQAPPVASYATPPGAPAPVMYDEPPARSSQLPLFIVIGVLGIAVIFLAFYFIVGPGAGGAGAPSGDTAAANNSAGGTPTGESGGATATPAVGGATLELTPADAEVSVDGNVIAGNASPRALTGLSVGTHKLKVSKGADYLPSEQDLVVVANASPTIPVKLALKNVTIEVTADPATATLELLAGETATAMTNKHALAREPGVDYKVRATAAGYTTTTVPISFDGSATSAVTVTMAKDAGSGATAVNNTPPPENGGETKKSGGTKKTPQPPKPKTAEFKVGVAPGNPPADVYVDGKKEGRTVCTVKVSAGSHTVKWKWDDGTSSTQKVSIKDGESQILKGAK